MGQAEGEFYYLFRLALRAGQSSREYWTGDPKLTWAYIDNYEEEQRATWKHEDMLNYQAGVYLMTAIGATFGDKPYPDDLLFYQPSKEEKIAKAKEEMKKLFGM